MISQRSSLSSPETDPLRNFKFGVTFRPPTGAAIPMGFMTCSGLAVSVDVIPYRQGGANSVTQKVPGQGDFGPLTFTNGVMLGGSQATQQQIMWMKQIFSYIQGASPAIPPQGPGALADFRYNADILIFDHPVTSGEPAVKAAFTVLRAWPTSLTFGDLDAGANQLFIAQMTLANEGWTPSIASSAGNSSATFGLSSSS